MALEVEGLLSEALSEISGCKGMADLREVEVKWLGKKGRVTGLLKGLSSLEPEERRRQGQALNRLKAAIEEAIRQRAEEVKREEIAKRLETSAFDVSLPGLEVGKGHLHPLSQVMEEVEDLFERMGYYVIDFEEVEDEFHNFEALNIPQDHPARDLQDTFYIAMDSVIWSSQGQGRPKGRLLLRTHTSPGQIRAMRTIPPPFRAIFPGRVYRFEATDASHEHTFHQVEGLMIDRSVSVANLLFSMTTMLEGIFSRKVEVRLRPGYFPFVEPGFELDLRCLMCGGTGCPVCKHSGWVEFLGCGLVHPKVIEAGGLDPKKWEGWAFGVGLSRLALLKYGIDDIRLLMSGDLRFIRQF